MAHRSDHAKRDVLGKALLLLDHIIDSAGQRLHADWGVRELSEALRLPPASVHRTLTQLATHGLVQHLPKSRRFRIGGELYRLAYRLSARSAFRAAGIPVMRDLAARCNENILLGQYDPARMEMMFVAAEDSAHSLRYDQPLNQWVPVYAGASGLAVMAYLPRAVRREIVRRTKLRPLTKNTITGPVRLEQELRRVRARGYASSRGHRNLGTVAFAAPVWTPDAEVAGSLIVAMPETRLDRGLGPQFGRLVADYAERLTTRLGGRRAERPDE
jgi:DNA-binding IclR family transcriptional regulator